MGVVTYIGSLTPPQVTLPDGSITLAYPGVTITLPDAVCATLLTSASYWLPGDQHTASLVNLPLPDVGVLGSSWTPPVQGASENAFRATLGANLTLSPPTNIPTSCGITIRFLQDATGGRTLTLGGGIKSPSGAGITLSSAPVRLTCWCSTRSTAARPGPARSARWTSADRDGRDALAHPPAHCRG